MFKRFFKFSWKISLIGLFLIVCMLRLSYWQWERHLQKIAYIEKLEKHINLPVNELDAELPDVIKNPANFINRRFKITGSYDFEHEILIRNRSLDGQPGVLILTPLLLDNLENAVLISRGFIPLKDAKSDKLSKYQTDKATSFVGLLKLSTEPKLLAPQDPPTGKDKTWVKEFLRVDIAHIAKQMPYSLLPFYLELMPDINLKDMPAEIVKGDSDKEELLLLPLKALKLQQSSKSTKTDGVYIPTPMFSTVVPTVRHLGYVFEWAAMAVMTFLVCLVLQLRRDRTVIPRQHRG